MNDFSKTTDNIKKTDHNNTNDYIVRATAANETIRAFAIRSTELTAEARRIHHTFPVVTAALGRLLSAGAIGVILGLVLGGAAGYVLGFSVGQESVHVTIRIKAQEEDDGTAEKTEKTV